VFTPQPGVVADWSNYYETTVKPVVFAPANRSRLDQWVKVAHLPFDANDYLNTVQVSVQDVLRYSVVNLGDAATTFGGFPFDNATRVYTGSASDFFLNLLVPRAAASPAALATMRTQYHTTGVLQRPLITLHTLRDQQVPFVHEQLYALKTFSSGALLARHLPIAIDRFEHCNFTSSEVLATFAIMLLYDGAIPDVAGITAGDSHQQIAAALALKLKKP